MKKKMNKFYIRSDGHTFPSIVREFKGAKDGIEVKIAKKKVANHFQIIYSGSNVSDQTEDRTQRNERKFSKSSGNEDGEHRTQNMNEIMRLEQELAKKKILNEFVIRKDGFTMELKRQTMCLVSYTHTVVRI